MSPSDAQKRKDHQRKVETISLKKRRSGAEHVGSHVARLET
jgi:hypothetical protein